MKMRKGLVAGLALGLFAGSGVCAVRSTSGNIAFDIDSDQVKEANLNVIGLGVGITAQANLHVAGNGWVSRDLTIGSSSGSDNFRLNGSLSLLPLLSSGGNVELTFNSVLMIATDSEDGRVSLPAPESVPGRVVKIKKLDASGNLLLFSGGNLIDHATTFQVPAGSSSDALAQVSLLSDGQQWWILSYMGPSAGALGADNLVIAYRLNESSGSSVSDESGNSRDASLENAHQFAGNVVSGVEGSALQLDDRQDAIHYNENGLLFSQAYTWSLWVKSNIDPDVTPTYDTSIPSTEVIGFNWSSGNSTWRKVAFHQKSNGDFVLGQIGSDIAADTWYHIATSWDGSILKTYLNGVLEASQPASSVMTHSGNLNLGNPGSEVSPTTAHDHFQLFNRSLSESEVYALFKVGSP